MDSERSDSASPSPQSSSVGFKPHRTMTQRKDVTAVISLEFVLDLLHKALWGVLCDFSPFKYLLSSQYTGLPVP